MTLLQRKTYTKLRKLQALLNDHYIEIEFKNNRYCDLKQKKMHLKESIPGIFS